MLKKMNWLAFAGLLLVAGAPQADVLIWRDFQNLANVDLMWSDLEKAGKLDEKETTSMITIGELTRRKAVRNGMITKVPLTNRCSVADIQQGVGVCAGLKVSQSYESMTAIRNGKQLNMRITKAEFIRIGRGPGWRYPEYKGTNSQQIEKLTREVQLVEELKDTVTKGNRRNFEYLVLATLPMLKADSSLAGKLQPIVSAIRSGAGYQFDDALRQEVLEASVAFQQDVVNRLETVEVVASEAKADAAQAAAAVEEARSLIADSKQILLKVQASAKKAVSAAEKAGGFAQQATELARKSADSAQASKDAAVQAAAAVEDLGQRTEALESGIEDLKNAQKPGGAIDKLIESSLKEEEEPEGAIGKAMTAADSADSTANLAFGLSIITLLGIGGLVFWYWKFGASKKDLAVVNSRVDQSVQEATNLVFDPKEFDRALEAVYAEGADPQPFSGTYHDNGEKWTIVLVREGDLVKLVGVRREPHNPAPLPAVKRENARKSLNRAGKKDCVDGVTQQQLQDMAA